MKTLIFFSLMFALPAFAANAETLSFADGALQAKLTWLQGPRMPAVSELQMEWKSGVDQTRVEPPGPVKVVLWMPMHGHGSSPVSLAKAGEEPGVYKISKMYFTMPGDWEVRVTLNYTNGRQETVALPVSVKR